MRRLPTFRFWVLSAVPIDGDTLACDLDLGMGLRWQGSLRLIGLNCPERTGAQSAAGHAVRDWVARVLTDEFGEHRQVASYRWDKFGGRLLGDVFPTDPDGGRTGPGLADRLIAAGLALPWDGSGPKPTWTEKQLAAIAATSRRFRSA